MTAKWILPLVLLITTKAYSYNFTQDFNDGFYWNTLPIPMGVAEPNAQAGALLKQLVNEAVDVWESSLGQDLWTIDAQVLPSASVGGNLIVWATPQQIQDFGHNPNSTLAVTLRHRNGPYYNKAEIYLNAGHPTLGNLNSLRSTLIHELGHTYGLFHSDDPSAIMYYQFNGHTSLHQDDVDGMSALIAETQRRLAIGYISPLAFEEESQTTSCATVDLGSGGGPGGPMSILFSLLLGLAMFAPISSLKGKTLPAHA